MTRIPERTPLLAHIVEAWAVAATLASTVLMKLLVS